MKDVKDLMTSSIDITEAVSDARLSIMGLILQTFDLAETVVSLGFPTLDSGVTC